MFVLVFQTSKLDKIYDIIGKKYTYSTLTVLISTLFHIVQHFLHLYIGIPS